MTELSKKRALELTTQHESAPPAKYARPSSSELSPALEQPGLTLATNRRIIREMNIEADSLRQNIAAKTGYGSSNWLHDKLSAVETFVVNMQATNDRILRSLEPSPQQQNRAPTRVSTVQGPASLLTLPRELRDRIYAMAMPWGNIHIQHHGDSYNMGSHRATSYERGKGFTRHLCRCEDTAGDDETETSKWINGKSGYYPDYETRHQNCLYVSTRRGDTPEPTWPFGLLFVCKKTHEELSVEVYKKNAFSFFHQDYLYAFATRIPAKNVSRICDLRLGLDMGSGRDELFHQEPEKSLAVCRAFSGVRKLHASLNLSFYKMPQMRDTLKTDWKIAHWARGLMNFGHLPLDHVSIFIFDCVTKHCRSENQRTIDKHFLEDAEHRKWANTIRDQLLAPWDRDAVLAFLIKHQRREEQYHRKLCYGRVGLFGDSCVLASPEQRIP